jgi:hypothetical protein
VDSLQVVDTSVGVGVDNFGITAMAAADIVAASITKVDIAATAAVKQVGKLLAILLYIIKD